MDTKTALPLAGQAALVSGGARRVGAEIVRHLHAAGANLAIHCHHSRDEAQALAAELETQRPGSTLIVQADLLQIDTFPALIDQVTARFGGLQLLVNNASSFYPTAIGAITPAAWDDLMGTNLRAPLFLTQAAAPALRASGGLVVNIVDIHGMRPLPDYIVYSTAKAGLIHLTRALARELAPAVRVNAVAPGPVLWPEAGLDEARQAEIIGRTLLGRAGTPADIARAVRYFACDAPYVTGQVLAVDGGRSAR
jgi:pteridine reductase